MKTWDASAFAADAPRQCEGVDSTGYLWARATTTGFFFEVEEAAPTLFALDPGAELLAAELRAVVAFFDTDRPATAVAGSSRIAVGISSRSPSSASSASRLLAVMIVLIPIP